MAKPGIEPVTSCSQALYATNWAMGLAEYNKNTKQKCY